MPAYWEAAKWEDTRLGRELKQTFYGVYVGISVFIVIRNKDAWQQLQVEELNIHSNSCECRWVTSSTDIVAESSTDSESTIQSSTLQSDHLEYGVIALRFPGYIHEKERKGYPPSFLFGRPTRHQRYADVWFSGATSMSRAQFILGVKNGCHVIRCLNGDLKIHEDVVIRAGQEGIALHHHEANLIQWERGRQRERYLN
jgi:hypothetical protein